MSLHVMWYQKHVTQAALEVLMDWRKVYGKVVRLSTKINKKNTRKT